MLGMGTSSSFARQNVRARELRESQADAVKEWGPAANLQGNTLLGLLPVPWPWHA